VSAFSRHDLIAGQEKARQEKERKRQERERQEEARRQDLIAAFNRVGQEIHTQETGWCEKAARRVLRAIQFEKDKKLRNRRYGEFVRPWKKRKQTPGIRWANHLATSKLKEKRWGRGKKPSQKVLSKIIARTAEILKGAKLKPRKNFIEQISADCAGQIQREWFPLKGKIGRPFGKRTDSENQRLSLEEIVIAVLPLIEEIANTNVKVVVSNSDLVENIKSPTFCAVVAAIKTERQSVSSESIARTIARVRKRARNLNPVTFEGGNALQ